MNESQPSFYKISLYSAALFFVLIGVYLLTYRGFPLSQDTYFIFDSAESFVQRGNFLRTYEFAYLPVRDPDSTVPWPLSSQEPFNIVLVAPFVWLGRMLPTVGTVHVTWLFNIFLTAFMAVNLFWGGLILRYSVRVAWLAALLFGTTTLAWTYSRFLFREPTATFFIMWCAIIGFYIQARWRDGQSVRWWVMALFGLAFLGAFLSKEVTIVLLPGLFVLLLPPFKQQTIKWVLIGAAIVLGILLTMIIIDSQIASLSARYSFNRLFRQLDNLNYSILQESILGYQFSFSRSIWLHSPILLVGLLGAWRLFKRGDWRLVAAPVLMVLALSAATSLHSVHWWGSVGWGPRYLLPLTPVLMLWVLPVLSEGLRGVWRGIFWVLAGLGALVQIVGASVPMLNYYTDMYYSGVLPLLSKQSQWGAYNWTWESSPLRYHLVNLQLNVSDIGWWFATPAWLAPAVIIVLLLAATGYAVGVHRGRALPHIPILCSLTVLMVASVGVGLHTLRDDNRYIVGRTDVRELINQLQDRVISGDTDEQIVFIDRHEYLNAFMNYFKAPVIVATLPYALGENYGGGAEVTSTNPEQQIGVLGLRAMVWAANNIDHIWLVASSSQFEPDKIRPIERFLASSYYPVEEIFISDRARAIRFLSVRAFSFGVQNVRFIFDNMLMLEAFALPLGSVFSAGDVVPVTLRWLPVAPIPEDYNISVQIATQDGVPVAQRDVQPQGTFGAMSRWQQGIIYHDNHGVLLPDDLPAGDYVLQVIVYRWQDGERLPYVSTNQRGDVVRLTEIRIVTN